MYLNFYRKKINHILYVLPNIFIIQYKSIHISILNALHLDIYQKEVNYMFYHNKCISYPVGLTV